LKLPGGIPIFPAGAQLHGLIEKGQEVIMNMVRRENTPLSTYHPTSIDGQFGRLIENILEDFFAPFAPYFLLAHPGGDAAASPRLQVAETDHAFEVEAELPGVKKEDVKVVVDRQRVSIEAETKRESEKKEGDKLVYSERSARKYTRSFMLPVEVDDTAAQAKLENGILTLSLPKKHSAQTRQLAIR
jgi:HSP20 family protein